MLHVDMSIPQVFLNRLKEIIPSKHIENVLETFSYDKPCVIRINTIKTSKKEIEKILMIRKVKYRSLDLNDSAILLNNNDDKESFKDLFDEGKLYIQNASSLIPALMLDLNSRQNVLDMCAAPGSKTSQMSALMEDQGNIYAVDAIRSRSYKLRAVLKLMGVTNTRVFCCDARRFISPDIKEFDRILIDAPCSSEGRFREKYPKTYQYWSERKIKEMVKKQRGILLSASRLLKKDGLMLYSTCSFSPEENEGVIDWFLKKTNGEFNVETIDKSPFPHYESLLSWKNKTFNPQVSDALRVLPDGVFEGFFVCLLRKAKV
ncbi:MAG: RsmB/NOP family class I SAM-dependent RNA methyltransferase [Candidatus Omnitrophica bacterium]|nr:RsmB/NOP family class I SAM-dependent RNA methyltransferase [Candidatus Omnitrophota bacterium]